MPPIQTLIDCYIVSYVKS